MFVARADLLALFLTGMTDNGMINWVAGPTENGKSGNWIAGPAQNGTSGFDWMAGPTQRIQEVDFMSGSTDYRNKEFDWLSDSGTNGSGLNWMSTRSNGTNGSHWDDLAEIFGCQGLHTFKCFGDGALKRTEEFTLEVIIAYRR